MPKKINVNIKGLTKNVKTRLGRIHNTEYIIAPVIMIAEGVLPGSGGPLLYTANEIQTSAPFWDGVPVTINHPSVDGNYASARHPDVMDEFGVGHIFNTRFDSNTNTLRAEAWINKNVIENNFPDVYETMMNTDANIEVSTGVMLMESGDGGDFNGIHYNSMATELYGDHLALLPNDTGACSWRDGCGLRANSKSPDKEHKTFFNQLDFGSITGALRRYVDSLDDATYIYYIYAVFSDYFVYEQIERQTGQRKLYRQNYSDVNDVIEPSGDPVRVAETRTFSEIPEDQPSPSGVTTNEGDEMAEKQNSKTSQENQSSCCPEKVDELIRAENEWSEDDREVLLSMNEKQLESVIAMANPEVNEQKLKTNAKEEIMANDMTVEQYIEKAPDHIKTTLNEAMAKVQKDRDDAIAGLLANENCTFTEDELKGFNLNHLEKMAGMSVNKHSKERTQENNADMSGNAGGTHQEKIPGNNQDTSDVEAYTAPTMDWKTK